MLDYTSLGLDRFQARVLTKAVGVTESIGRRFGNGNQAGPDRHGAVWCLTDGTGQLTCTLPGGRLDVDKGLDYAGNAFRKGASIISARRRGLEIVSSWALYDKMTKVYGGGHLLTGGGTLSVSGFIQEIDLAACIAGATLAQLVDDSLLDQIIGEAKVAGGDAALIKSTARNIIEMIKDVL